MLEDDYIMRLIIELIRFFIKAIFNIDLGNKDEIQGEDVQLSEDANETLLSFISLIDKGQVNLAENLLYEHLDPTNIEDLKIALLFYDHLNSMDPEFLERSDFTYEEIKEGMEQVMRMYGYESLLGIFLH